MPQPDLAGEQAELDELLKFWQPVLRIADWEIAARIDPAIAPNLGMCLADHVYKRADIRVAPKATPGQDLEASLVHELVHCPFAWVETKRGTAARNEEERSVEGLMRGFIDLKRKGVPLNEVQARARNAFDARARKGPLAPGRGQEKHRMDASVLAALAIEAGQIMGQEGIPDEVKALLKKFVEAMAGGGGEPPQSQAEPPAAGAPPGEDPNKPPMAGAPPGEEKKPPMMRLPPELDQRLRKIETDLEADKKERQAADEKKRTALLADAKPRIPEAQHTFAAGLSLTQLETYVGTLPARAPVERGASALRGGPRGAGDDTDSRTRLREAMGIPDTSVTLPHRDEAGRRTWPVNGPTALRRALSKPEGAQ